MDRLNQLRGEAGGSRDFTLDTSSPPSESYMTANESSKYYSLSEVDSTFDISSIKDVPLASTTSDAEETITGTDRLISNLSPIAKKNDVDSYKIGKQIEASKILSGGIDIFDDNENSYDGDELVIDDNVDADDKSNSELKLPSMSVLPYEKADDNVSDSHILDSETAVASKDTEVVLQIDGKNVDAIDIGNGLYLYRKENEEELAAVQITDDGQQQPTFKFLKVRENAEGNLEVYEEIEIEVPKEVTEKEGNICEKSTSHVPIKDINKVISESGNKVAERIIKTPQKETAISSANKQDSDSNKDLQSEHKAELNLNGKMMKISDSRKSPLIGSFTPMTYHSTPNKEGIPLTKTMVDQQLHPNRHSDNVKKTIEVHTDNSKQKVIDVSKNSKEFSDEIKESDDLKICDKTEEPESSDKTNITTQSEFSEAMSPRVNENIVSPSITSESLVEKPKLDTNTVDDLLPKKLVHDISDSHDIETPGKVQKGHNDKIEYSETHVKELDCHNPTTETELKPKEHICGDLSSIDLDKVAQNLGYSDVKVTENIDSDVKKNEIREGTLSKIVSIESAQKIDIPKVKMEDITLNQENASSKEKLEDVTSLKLVEKNETSKEKSEDATLLQSIQRNETGKEKLEGIPLLQSVQESLILSDKSEENALLLLVQKNEAPEQKLEENQLLPSVQEKETPKETLKGNPSSSSVPINETPNNKSGEITPSNTDPKDKKLMKESDGVNVANEMATKNNESEKITDMKDKNNDQPQTLTKNEQAKDTKTSMTAMDASNTPLSRGLIPDNNKNNDTIGNNDKINLEVFDKTNTNVLLKQKNQENETKISERNENANVKQDNSILCSNTSKVDDSLHIIEKNVQRATKNTNFEEDHAKKQTKELPDKKPEDIINLKPCKDGVKADIIIKDEIQKSDKQPIPSTIPKIAQNYKKEVLKQNMILDVKDKPINNNHTAVPFGKWTEVNRQEFLNKIKESKVSTNSASTNQIKQPNDLNRRDVLKKIDSQRQSIMASAKAHEASSLHKQNVKSENTAFTNSKESKIPVKIEESVLKKKTEVNNSEPNLKLTQIQSGSIIESNLNTPKKDVIQRKEINNQDLIDKTIEGMINRTLPAKTTNEETKQHIGSKVSANAYSHTYTNTKNKQSTLDAIEMKMNELHGIPFVERPPHELPQVHNHDVTISKTEGQKDILNKPNKIPKLLPLSNQHKVAKDLDIDSEEEVIEHEPITGDIYLHKKNTTSKLINKEKSPRTDKMTNKAIDTPKQAAVITEKDFDKFVRRNSRTYENYLTVNFDGSEPHNVIQSVKQKDVISKTLPVKEITHVHKSSGKPQAFHQIDNPLKGQSKTLQPINEDNYGKNYPSKLQMAYQSALTAKRQMDYPFTVIEDKPVEVVFMDSNSEFIPSQLNVQGEQLSPAKKKTPECEALTPSTCDSLDSDMLETIEDDKPQDEFKYKTKHQRKQVLTPVEAPELELIEPSDLGIEVSPKKKRRSDDNKVDKRNLLPKKTYLLGRSLIAEDTLTKQDTLKNPLKETINRNDIPVSHKNTVSAIDNLVKAAELLENQSENVNTICVTQNSESQPITPVKRGRGRPRKYPLPEGTIDKNKIACPQKKPRFIDAKLPRQDISTEDDSSEDEVIKENWTMGKINENIVCPICNKLFRSENVVFKHVKHCTGPSPNRSESGRSRRTRQSQESDTKLRESKSEDTDIDSDNTPENKEVSVKRKSKISSKSPRANDDIIVIGDTPLKEKPKRQEETKGQDFGKTIVKSKLPYKTGNLVCEFCGKTFRQFSYLVNHKLQHKKESSKNTQNNDTQITKKTVFSCEVCKKEFRKLHHLVQHRIIHNPNTMSSRLLRKSSSEQNDTKSHKNMRLVQQNEDQSAGFRCEPCDKSFRKLHHLVEHRETHDGINRQKNASIVQTNVEKSVLTHECDICKKTFKKLQHLMEHKEQHLETSSEKSDDKSVKSSLSTKDIIHECPLCYMVFPNEHSLNKHTIICQRKKKQAAKQAKQAEENQLTENTNEACKLDENKEMKSTEEYTQSKVIEEKECLDKDDNVSAKLESDVLEQSKIDKENVTQMDLKSSDNKLENPCQKDVLESINPKNRSEESSNEISVKNKELEKKDATKVQETPKRKTQPKEKVAQTVTKRQKTTHLTLAVVNKRNSDNELGDDDEIRYMLNPDFNPNETTEAKFMKIRAKKRNSLQIERPNSKELNKRRTSLQHPPKIPRLKPKPIGAKITPTNTVTKNFTKIPKMETVPSSDSDDSDIKYSFPKTVLNKSAKLALQGPSSKEAGKKKQKKSLEQKRKSLNGIAKRKSLGKTITAARRKAKPSPFKQFKRRSEVEHRCDCGQLFNSGALLSQHVSLAHTPPRIRRRRSPAPPTPLTETKLASTKPTSAGKPKPADTKQPNPKSDKSKPDRSKHTKQESRKSNNKSDAKIPRDSKVKSSVKTEATAAKTPNAKKRQTAAYKGVPVPERKRRLMESKK